MITAARSTAVGTPEPSRIVADLARASAGAARAPRPAVGGEAAEVDEPAARPRAAAAAANARAVSPVGVLERRPRAQRVDQVVGDVDAVAARAAATPASAASAATTSTWPAQGWSRSRSGERAMHAHPVPGREQLGDQPPADVAGGAGDEAEQGGPATERAPRGVT